jgi:hypothetical protein
MGLLSARLQANCPRIAICTPILSKKYGFVALHPFLKVRWRISGKAGVRSPLCPGERRDPNAQVQ